MSATTPKISDEAVEAAWIEACNWIDPPHKVDSTRYVRSPTDPPPGPAREAALAALKADDELADRLNRNVMRRILEAAAAVEGR